LTELGLPAPRPFAARVVKSGLFYRADLITSRLSGASSLAECLAADTLPENTWRAIGRTIAQFHSAGLWHADLNAHNVLVNERGKIALVDFDRARFRSPAAGWQEANLARLLRSLKKLKRTNSRLKFHGAEFESLREGYRERK
jgi:3-deoxy-D-manno-octulosonic acid kinase